MIRVGSHRRPESTNSFESVRETSDVEIGKLDLTGDFPPVSDVVEEVSKRRFRELASQFKKKAKALFYHSWKVVSLTNTTLSGVRGVVFATAPLWNQSSAIFRIVQGSRLLAALRLPFSFFNIGVCFNTLFTKKRPYQIDAALTIVSETGVVADATSTFAAGLSAVGAVAPTAVAFSGPLMLVAAILSVAGLIANIRGFIQTRKVIRQLQQEFNLPDKKKYDLDDLHTVMQFIEDRSEYTTKQMWKVKKEDLKGSLELVHKTALVKIASSNPEIKAEGEKEVHEAVSALKGRLNKKIYSHVVSGIACVVAMIGMIVVVTGGIGAPAGFALLAIAAGISIGLFVYNLKNDKKFRKSIGLKCYLKTIPRKATPVKPTSKARRLVKYIEKKLAQGSA